MAYKIVEAVLDRGPREAMQALLLVALAESANEKGAAWPGLEKLSLRCRRTQRQTGRVLKALENDGWFSLKRNAAGDTGKQTLYQISLSKLGLTLDTQASSDIAMSKDTAMSKDIEVGVHSTFQPFSLDISDSHILRNRRTVEPSTDGNAFSLEGEQASPKERVVVYEEDEHRRGGEASQSKPQLVHSRGLGRPGLTNEQVDQLYKLFPNKVEPAKSKKLIRVRHAELMTSVRPEGLEHIPQMDAEQAFQLLLSGTTEYAGFVRSGAIEKVLNCTTFYGPSWRFAKKSAWPISRSISSSAGSAHVKEVHINPSEWRRQRDAAASGGGR